MPVFCDVCGSIMKVKERRNDTIIYICPVCGATKEIKAVRNLKRRVGGIVVQIEKPIASFVDESKLSKGALVSVICPKCGYDKAYVVIMQTRAADEPPTRIYRCARCGHVWREYS